MTMFAPDYSEAKDLSPPKDGRYPVKVTEWKRQADPIYGDKVFWKLRILKSERPGEVGKAISLSTNLSGQFAWRLKRFLEAIDPEYTGGPFDPNEILGKELEVVIQTKEGKNYPDVKEFHPYVSPGSLADALLGEDFK